MHTVDLEALIKIIGEGYPFTEEHYPRGDFSTPEKALAFAVAHSHMHMAKTAGRIAAEAEAYDHGGEMNLEKLQVAAVKSVINALNLANALGMTAEELAGRVPLVMRVF